jgi:hypothetical protein
MVSDIGEAPLRPGEFGWLVESVTGGRGATTVEIGKGGVEGAAAVDGLTAWLCGSR